MKKPSPKEFAVTSTATTFTSAGIAVDEHTASGELSVDRAHRLMQVRLECTTADCGARRTALTLLVAEKRYVLDLTGRRR